MKKYFGFAILFVTVYAQAQSFNIVDVNQIFRPSINVQLDQTLPQKITDKSEGWLSLTQFKTSALIPVAGDLGMQVDIDWSRLRKPKEFFKNPQKWVRPKGYQVLINPSFNYIKPSFSKRPNTGGLVQYDIGALVLHYTKGPGAAFYGLNLGVAENTGFPGKITLRYSLYAGHFKVKNLKTQIFYGAAIVPGPRNLPIPVPFVGLNKKLNKKWRFDMLLPVQIGMIYKYNKRLKQYFNVGFNAINSGFYNGDGYWPAESERVDWSLLQLRFKTTLKYKVSKKFYLQLHGGVNSGSFMRVGYNNETVETEYLTPTLFFNVSANVIFTKSIVFNLLEKLTE